MSKDSANMATDAIKNLSMMEQQANNNLGITQEYNKENRDKLWDSQKGKADYKDKVLGIKKLMWILSAVKYCTRVKSCSEEYL